MDNIEKIFWVLFLIMIIIGIIMMITENVILIYTVIILALINMILILKIKPYFEDIQEEDYEKKLS